MIDFERAIGVATKNAKSLINNAQNISLEGILISDDKSLYEVSLSYDLQGKDPLGAQQNNGVTKNNLLELAKIMSYRKEYKIFLVDKESGEFRGFKNQQ